MLTLVLVIAVVLAAAVIMHPLAQARLAAEQRQRRIARVRAQTYETERRVQQVAQAAQAEILRLLMEHRGRPSERP